MMVDAFLKAGATGLTILGIMGEAQAQAAAESADFIKDVLQAVGGQIPVVVGVSSPGFAAMSALARQSMDAGAAGVMIAPTLRL